MRLPRTSGTGHIMANVTDSKLWQVSLADLQHQVHTPRPHIEPQNGNGMESSSTGEAREAQAEIGPAEYPSNLPSVQEEVYSGGVLRQMASWDLAQRAR